MTDVRAFYGWKLVAVLCLVTACDVGAPQYGAGVINPVMMKDLGLDRSTLGLGFTVFVLVAGFSAPIAAKFVASIGARLTLVAGSLLVALGALVMASWATLGWHYVITFGILVGTGCGWVATVPTQACIAVWFTKKRAFAMSVVLTGAGVGGFIAAPLLTRVIAACEGNWRVGWYLVFAAGAMAALLSLLFVRNRPSDCGQLPEEGIAGAAVRAADQGTVISQLSVHRTTHNWTVREAVRARAMWLIGLAAVGVIMPETAVLAHGVSNLRDLGHSPSEAAGAIGLVALGSILGKLTGGTLCDRFEPRYVWCACNVVTGVGILVVTHASSAGAMYLFVILMGVGGGASLSCWSPMVANYFGPASVASILGAQYPVNNVFAAAAPYLVGAVYDAQSSYIIAFYGVAIIAICSGLLLLAATPPNRENVGITIPAT